MPFSDKFNKIRRKFKRLYDDNAKAETFAFMEAFKLKVPTFQERRRRFKKQEFDRFF